MPIIEYQFCKLYGSLFSALLSSWHWKKIKHDLLVAWVKFSYAPYQVKIQYSVAIVVHVF